MNYHIAINAIHSLLHIAVVQGEKVSQLLRVDH